MVFISLEVLATVDGTSGLKRQQNSCGAESIEWHLSDAQYNWSLRYKVMALGKHEPAGTALRIRSLSPSWVIFMSIKTETPSIRRHVFPRAQTLIFSDFSLAAHYMMQDASWIAKPARFGLKKCCNPMGIDLAWIMRTNSGRGHTKQALQCTYFLTFLSREFKYHQTILVNQCNLSRGILLRLALWTSILLILES